ncbi:ATP-binding protein [Psychromonas sp.]|uniref:HD domain-containing protein n=1 Tax=Psychromonas sp. TaxID=1884585 RepID=UPI0039E60B39
MKLSLPIKFNNIIEKNSSLYGALFTVIDRFSGWLGANNTEFFPEYTDHGIEHIQSVLNTTEEIITDESWNILTPEDIYVLTSSILLHDCAMHITKSGLWDLISSDIYNGVLLGFSREDEWSKRWEKFSSDVTKFDESDFTKFFGEDKNIELPEKGCSSMNDDQKVLIGDFVRQYHACIAQIIATHGMPTRGGPYELFNKEFKYLNELSGLVARSHNHSLRTVVDLLDDRKREFRNTHPTYLMGVLRISDYLQFKSDRTPKILFNTMGFCSPISINEWKKHLAIISTNTSHPDDELLFVEAFPEDAKTLVGIKYLLTGLQKELDEFWAVNGEVYSRYPQVQKLAIVFRRVKSNIDNASQYVEKNYKSYHPEILSIKTDDQKLFPLLIKPLYGNHPKIGLRELLQNALDACNERFCIEQGCPANDKTVPFQIHVELNFDNNTLMIKDQGVGMDVDVIKNYFLKIGSSYRTSENWKSNFMPEGHALVPRTGKFGIGMLAGFLIGHKIEVHTKYHNDSDVRAISFSYKLDSNEIELIFSDKQDIGTTIIIHTNKESLTDIENGLAGKPYIEHLYYEDKKPNTSWWYYLDSPEIIVNVLKENITTEKHAYHNLAKRDLFENWQRVNDSILEGVLWKRSAPTPYLYCNGIMIQNMKTPMIKISYGISTIQINDLEICVFDNQGVFPLNLTRDALVTDKFFEIEKLNKSVKNIFIEEVKVILVNYKFNQDFIKNVIQKYPINNYNTQLLPLVFLPEKVIPFTCKELFEKTNYTFVDFISTSQKRGVIYEQNFIKLFDDMAYSCVLNVDKQASIIEHTIYNYILNKTYENYWSEYSSYTQTGQYLDSWLFVKNFDLDKLSPSFKNAIPSALLQIRKINDYWSVLTHPNNIDNIPRQGGKIVDLDNSKYFMFAIYKAQSAEPTEFATLWDNSFE